MKELNKILHQPIRTQIMAHLINTQECDYTGLKNALNLSDGHMSTHMRELINSNYVEAKKEFINNKPKTTYAPTPEGKKHFQAYINTLKEIINLT